jgi:RHS repeat-associated protein
VITKYQNGLGIDNKLKLTTNGTSKYFLQDHLGSTNALTNSSGNVNESTSYDAFGNASNNLTTRYSYTGREYDSFTGLYYYRARFYDAKLGRFISEDPIGLNGGINQFSYVSNNPANRIDPSGLIDLGWGSPTGPKIPFDSDCSGVCDECDFIPEHKPEWSIDKDIKDAENGPWDPNWYYNQVQGGHGPWDYKMQGEYLPNGRRRYESYGNFAYGATCRAFGFTRYMCSNEAGIAQHPDDDPNPGQGAPGSRWSYILPVPGLNGWGDYGDDADDQEQIKRGMDYYDSNRQKRKCGCKK